MLTSENNRKIGIFLQYLQMGLSVVVSFIYTPIMLRILGSAEYGLYNLANSIISYLSLFSLGFGASYIRFYSRYKSRNDTEGIKNLNGLFLTVFVCIGIVAFFCGVLLSNNISLLLNETYSARSKELGKILMLVMAFNLAWSFPASVFTSYITAQEKFVFQKLVNMIKTVVGPFLTLPLLLLGYGSIGMVTVTTLVTLGADCFNILYCLKKINMEIHFGKFDFKLLRQVISFSIFIAINQLIDQINWATDKVILGKICSSTAVAYYSIGAQINTYFTQFSTAISSVYIPQIHRIETSDLSEEDKNRKYTMIFTNVGKMQFIILSLILTGFVLYGQYFISIWAGKDYRSSYYVSLLLMTPAIVPLIQNLGIEIQRAKNKHQFRSFIYLIMALINIGLSIEFAKIWGEIGAALGTTFSLIVANGLIMNVFYHKILGINVLYFWKSILKLLPSIMISNLIFLIILHFYTVTSMSGFFIGVFCYCVIYFIFIYFLGLDMEEKSYISRIINRLCRKL